MKRLVLAALCAAFAGAAYAQDETAPAAPVESAPSPYAVPVETLQLSGARAGFAESGSSAGGYSLIVRRTSSSSSVFTRTRMRFSTHFRFVHGETNALAGVCRIKMDGNSLWGIDWNQRTTQAYACEFDDQPPEQYALEVAIPAFNESRISIGNFGMTAERDVDEAELHAILRARLVYQGATYEALPTAFREETLWARRLVEGYVITRDGAPVGRIDFQSGNINNRATLAAPASDADGRAAVLFLLLHLNAMPDLYSPVTRGEMMQND
ncbi:MAG: hypothetical protein AB7H66_16880 [Hyphomonadaceae bacterium]